ncbi:excinuclease ABC subunit UvrC [Candidatus Saccharibacteria bacterium]|nr:excinuclease ABC subunit UvrC [Candidatus Saccharibacteria bacterium]
MNKKLEAKLNKLPTTPGVYFHKNKAGEIIYIGKAANLRNRVRQYFQKSRFRDPKTDVLVSEIADIDWTELNSEADALFLEAELVRRYMPRFNILLRDDKSLQFVRIDYKSDYPTVSLVRRPLDDGARYFGPYISGFAVKRALRYLRRAFPYATKRQVGQKRASLHYHLGLDPGLEEGKTSLSQYRANLRKLMKYLEGGRQNLSREIERDMKKAAKTKDFETAAHYRNQLQALNQLDRQILFSDREIQDASNDAALSGLAELLELKKPPVRIEGYDISHMQGTDTVASMVVFISGVPNKTAYRKFKMKLPGNDDFAHMNEVISRRLSEKNTSKWGVPELILIDGGKGQLSSALQARDSAGYESLPTVGLAKREEEIVVHAGSVAGVSLESIEGTAQKLGAFLSMNGDYLSVTLGTNSPITKLLQRVRDESHRFAVSYHSTLKRGRQTSSILDQAPGIGPATRKKLIRSFGSARAVGLASLDELGLVLGPVRAKHLYDYLKKPL